MTEKLPTVPSRGQRIVLQHTAGPFKGLHQIVGHSDEFKGTQAPTLTEPSLITPGARQGVAQLVQSKPRYLLYRELTKPEGLGTFDTRQR